MDQLTLDHFYIAKFPGPILILLHSLSRFSSLTIQHNSFKMTHAQSQSTLSPFFPTEDPVNYSSPMFQCPSGVWMHSTRWWVNGSYNSSTKCSSLSIKEAEVVHVFLQPGFAISYDCLQIQHFSLCIIQAKPSCYCRCATRQVKRMPNRSSSSVTLFPF